MKSVAVVQVAHKTHILFYELKDSLIAVYELTDNGLSEFAVISENWEINRYGFSGPSASAIWRGFGHACDHLYFPEPRQKHDISEFVAHLQEIAKAPDKKPHNAKTCANWIINDLASYLNKDGLSFDKSPVKPSQLGELIDLIEAGTISTKIAKDVFKIMWEEGGDPAEIVAKRDLGQISDSGELEAAVEAVVSDNPEQAAKAKDKPGLLGWFTGQVMQQTRGKADPKAVQAILKEKLGLN